MVLYEGDFLALPVEYAQVVRRYAFGRAQARIGDSVESDELGFADLLLEEVVAPGQGCDIQILGYDRTSPFAENDQIHAMWTILASTHDLDTIVPPSETVLLERLIEHVPVMEQVVFKAFLDELSYCLRRKRSEFQPFSESLQVVRGRVDSRALVEREARGLISVTCVFDDLSDDTPVWRLVRAALRLVSGQAEAPALGTQAGRLDSVLDSVTIVDPVSAILAVPVVDTVYAKYGMLNLVRLSRCIVLHRYPVGGLDLKGQDSMAEIKVATSSVWEQLIVRSLGSARLDWLVKNRRKDTSLMIFEHGATKFPDIILEARRERSTRVGRLAVVDAKYKFQRRRENGKDMPATIAGQLSMADQYQCFAYASILKVPSVFVVEGRCSKLLAKDRVRTDAMSGSTGLGSTVAVWSLPFPRPGMVDIEEESVLKFVRWLEDEIDI
ncbi:MAG: hypothetical protein WAW85_10975 [Gordonia sp. (in: high G+C Gram-positive bacteria)]|uniref:5-methylcytosine restriction system specificity protein McrC n=1 Tax=Gordonia sp. (in: high G+C Gram-positive bacteria) TaxID=84139 RepID=UPI003BB4DEDA